MGWSGIYDKGSKKFTQNSNGKTCLIVPASRIWVVQVCQTTGNRLHESTDCKKVGHLLCCSIHLDILTLEHKGSFIKMFGTTHSTTQCHFPEDLSSHTLLKQRIWRVKVHVFQVTPSGRDHSTSSKVQTYRWE